MYGWYRVGSMTDNPTWTPPEMEIVGEKWIGELPPPLRSSPEGHRWWDEVAPLLNSPGEWFVLRKGPKGSIRASVSNLRHRKVRYQPGRFEFSARYDPDFPETTIKMILLGRYLGPEGVVGAEPVSRPASGDPTLVGDGKITTWPEGVTAAEALHPREVMDDATRASLQRGIEQAERGELVDAGSFEQYLDDDDDDQPSS